MAKLIVHLSKMITAKFGSARTVVSSMLKHRKKVSEQSREALLPFWPAEAPFPELEAVIVSFASYLKMAAEEMVQADQGHTTEMVSDRESRGGRDVIVSTILAELTKLRAGLKGVFSEGDVAKLGIYRPLGDTPLDVLRQCNHIVKALDESGPMTPILEGAELALAKTTRVFRELVAELRVSLDALDERKRDTEETLLTKDRSITEYHRVFIQVSRIWEALCRLAGFDEEAARVRPSTQHPGQTVVEPDDDGDGDMPEIPELTELAETAPTEPVS